MSDTLYRRGDALTVTREAEDTTVVLRGYALRWDDEQEIFPGYYEQFAKGSFPEDARDNTAFLVGHGGQPLARVSTETMELKEDKDGLFVMASVDTRDPEAASLVSKVERGDVDGQSVGFSMRGGESVFEYDDDDTVHRTITRVGKLIEVSAVYNPAYPSSSLGARELRSREVPEDVIEFLARGTEAPPDLELTRQKASALRTLISLGGK